MRCFSCGTPNAPHILECVNCRKILDPIAAAVTVGGPAQAQAQTQVQVQEGFLLEPVRVAAPSPQEAVSLGLHPARRNLASADLEFLVDSAGSNRLQRQDGRLILPEGLQPTWPVRCPRCRRSVPYDKMVLAVRGRDEQVCQACQARQVEQEERLPGRLDGLRVLGGLLMGLIGLLACVLFARQLGLAANGREINWVMSLGVGIIIGTAVRLGGFNKPSAALQWIALGLAIVALTLVLLISAEAINGSGLSLGGLPDAIRATGAGLIDYALGGLSLLLAFGIPSGIIGGHKEY